MTWALYPLLVVAMTAWAVLGSTWDLASPLGRPPAESPGLLALATIALFYPSIAALERLAPYRPEWRRGQDDTSTDALHLLITGPSMSALYDVTLRSVSVVAGTWLSARMGFVLWPVEWPAVPQLFLAILVAELGHYGFHRLAHEHPLVWRLHAVHHSAPRLYWLNATRFHPLDLACLITVQTTPLLMLGIPPRTFLMYGLFQVAYGQLQHANLDVRTPRALDHLFSTPGVHRWHHSIEAREGNANYGAILSVWDVVFGTLFRPAERDFDGRVGLTGLPGFPRRYLAQLAAPLRWERTRMAPRDSRAGAGIG